MYFKAVLLDVLATGGNHRKLKQYAASDDTEEFNISNLLSLSLNVCKETI